MIRGAVVVAAALVAGAPASASAEPRPLEVTPSYVPRAHPPGPGRTPADSFGYFYVAFGEVATMTGAGAALTLAQPRVSTVDYHSLAEIAVESTAGRQLIEIGWNIDPGVNTGDVAPHLFSYHWIDGAGTCYNGCGWVQVSATHAPGMPVAVDAAPHVFQIEHRADARWWLTYDGDDLGYYPDTEWSGGYTAGGFTQWFGEVAAGAEASPCTEMGNAKRGTEPDSDSFSGIYIFDAAGTQAPAAVHMTSLTDAAAYAQGRVTTSSFGFGGPGTPAPSCAYYGDVIADGLAVDAGASPDAARPAETGDSGGCCDTSGGGGGSSVLLGAAVLGFAWRRRR